MLRACQRINEKFAQTVPVKDWSLRVEGVARTAGHFHSVEPSAHSAMKEVADDEEHHVAGNTVAETAVVAILQVEEHFLDGQKIQRRPDKAERQNGKESDHDAEQRDENKNAFEKSDIGVQPFGDFVAIVRFAKPACAKTILKFLDEGGISERRRDFRLLEAVFCVAIRNGNLADFAFELVKFRDGFGTEHLGHTLFLFVGLQVVPAGRNEGSAGDFFPGNGFGAGPYQSSALHTDAGVTELDVDGKGAGIDLEAGGHVWCWLQLLLMAVLPVNRATFYASGGHGGSTRYGSRS